MSVTTMIVVIVAIVALTMLRIAKYRSRRGSALAAPPVDDGEKIALRHEVHDLRERIKVLERIATDANTATAVETRRVADEIEALRDR